MVNLQGAGRLPRCAAVGVTCSAFRPPLTWCWAHRVSGCSVVDTARNKSAGGSPFGFGAMKGTLKGPLSQCKEVGMEEVFVSAVSSAVTATETDPRRGSALASADQGG